MVARRSPEQAEQLVLDLIAAHADSLLRTARRYSLCADDAQDAYQRGLEILMRHAGAPRRRPRRRLAPHGRQERGPRDQPLARAGSSAATTSTSTRSRRATAPSPEERVLGFEQVARSAEALQRLKPQEVRALWLKAMGNSYQEICDATGWTYTKVNRCLAEGRKSFLARYAGIEAGEECRRWAPVLSAMVDGEATAEQVLELRPHLRNCAGCRAALRELRGLERAARGAVPGRRGRAPRRRRRRSTAPGEMLSRVWHALWGELSDRAATAALRAHSMAQAILPGKSMAIAASVAAMAGGGFAIDEAVLQAPRTDAARADRCRPRPIGSRRRTSRRSSARRPPRRPRRPRSARRGRVRRGGRRSAGRACAAGARRRPSSARRGPGHGDGDGAAGRRRPRAPARARASARATPTPAAPAPRVAAARTPARARTAVPGEFGLEDALRDAAASAAPAALRGIPIARPARSGRGSPACARAIRSIRSSSAASAALARSVAVSTWSSICSAVAISASSSLR